MTVAILIPLHNTQDTIKETLLSVVQQTITDWKLFIVLNNCTDNTENAVRQFVDSHGLWNKVVVLQQPEPGIAPALNKGLVEILKLPEKYEWVARLDGDDTWYPTKLEKQLLFLQQNPDVSVLGTQMIVCVDSEPRTQTFNPTTHEEIVKAICNSNNPLSHPSVVFRTSMLFRTGLYDDVVPYAEDFWLWMKCVRWFKMANLNEPLVRYNLNKQANPLHSRMVGHMASLVNQHLVSK